MIVRSSSWRRVLNDWTQIISPHLCIFCEAQAPLESNPAVCENCTDIGWQDTRCKRCQKSCHEHDAQKRRCSRCKSIAYPFERFISLGPYKGSLRKAILLYKFNQDPLALRFLQHKISELDLPQLDHSTSVWTYIPSHKNRIKERGGRGQHLPRILKPLKQKKQCSISELLKKDQNRKPQIELNEKERRAPMDQSLRYIGPTPPPKTVYLFDDVWTTGTTLSSGARVLKQAGVEKVFVLSLAFNDLQTPRKTSDSDL